VDQDEFSNRLTEQVPGLLRYARTIVSHPQRAEDLVQDTLVRALERSSSFRGEASMATWLHSILHNIAVDQTRRNRESPTDMTDAAAADEIESLWKSPDYTVDSALVIERAETRELLQDALLRLPLIYRSAVVLHDEEGITMSDIADIQRIGLPAAKQRLRRGRMMLLTELTAGAGEVPIEPEAPMRCWDARRRVSDYIDQELTQRQRSLLEAHLESCPMCPPLYAGLVGIRDALGVRRDSDAVIPAEVAARIAGLAGT
jgi:RNA polymerase sigma-70 factor (ECF subfamily)